VVTIETEPDEAEEDTSIEHTSNTPLASKIDEDEEATEHAKRENDVLYKDSIEADLKEGNEDRLSKIKETIDVLNGEFNLLTSKKRILLLTLEVSDNTHDIEDKSSDGGEESNPADKTKDGEVVAEKKDEENIDSAEDSEGLDEIIPKEDGLHLTEEFALLEGLADHLARALTRAGGSSLGLLLLSGLLLRSGFLSLGFLLDGFLGLGFFNRGLNFFFRHV